MKNLVNPAKYSKKQQFILFASLCLVFLIINITSLFFPIKQSLTYDEIPYYVTGQAILSGKPSTYGAPTKTPAQALYPLTNRIIKKIVPNQIMPESVKDSQKYFISKLVTIFVSLILAGYIFWWARQLYGINAGFLALCLYIFDPNIIAHSRIVHQNIFESCIIFVATYYFWCFLKFRDVKNAVFSIVTFGLAQITRYTAIYLFPIYFILWFGFYHSTIFQLFKIKNYQKIISGLKKIVIYTVLYGLTALLLINIGFSWEGTFTRFGDYKFKSDTLTSIQSSSPLIQALPVPFPRAYINVVDLGRALQEKGRGQDSGSYLMGEISSGGFREYYLIAFLYKVPIATQLLLLMGIVSLIRDRKQVKFWQNEAFLVVPSVIFFAILSKANLQLGIRYILFILPFLFVIASRVMIGWNVGKIRYHAFIIILLLYLIISNLSYFPHYISYFNELLVNRKMGYTILADSNLDWGQNDNYIIRYLEDNPQTMYTSFMHRMIIKPHELESQFNPERIFAPSQPKAGELLIGANELVGILGDAPYNRGNPETFRWIRENLQPIAHVGYSHVVFKIEPKHLEFIRIN
jgi:hypothetical protein